MSELYLVTGAGHCGTAWAAQVFDRPQDGIKSYHEAKKRASWADGEYNWTELTNIEVNLGVGGTHDFYFEGIQQELGEWDYVVDSNGFIPAVIPKVAKRIDIAGVILLVRNGIQNVHSLAHHDPQFLEAFPQYEDFTHYTCDAVGCDIEWENEFEMWCVWWSCNAYLPLFLAQRMPQVKGATALLEGLTQDVFELKQMLWWVNPELDPDDDNLRKIQETDVNRKIEGDRSPEALWHSWTVFQRESFVRICGDAMNHFEYEIPHA